MFELKKKPKKKFGNWRGFANLHNWKFDISPDIFIGFVIVIKIIHAERKSLQIIIINNIFFLVLTGGYMR